MGNQVPTQKSRWDDTGVEPPAGEARYVAGEQPIAEYDNWFNKAVVDDIASIIVFLRNLGLTKIYQDVEENIPESGATTELFIATDTGKIYIGTGSGWRELTVDWNAILNKPSNFPPSPHQHDDADLLSIDWSKILNKPATFPPSAHQHDASEIVSGVLDIDRIPSLSRSKISDFFSAPFWDNIPDKPEGFPVLNFRELATLPATPRNWEVVVNDSKLKVYNPECDIWESIYHFAKKYTGFDNNGGDGWVKYINIPIITIPSEYAQYKIVIDNTYVKVYSADGTLKALAPIASDFWSLVKSDGSDIRVFDQAKSQLYFWIEEFDYANKRAIIWVKLEAGSSELNIAYGNPSALLSSYNNISNTFELFRYDPFDSLDTNFWTHREGTSIGVSTDTYISPSRSLKLYYETGEPWHSDCAASLPPKIFWIMEYWWRNSGSDPSTVSDPDRGGGSLLTGGAHGTAVVYGTVYLDKIDYGDGVTESGSFQNVWLHFRLIYDDGNKYVYRDVNGKWVLKKYAYGKANIDTVKFGIAGYYHAEYADDLYLWTVKDVDPANFETPQILDF